MPDEFEILKTAKPRSGQFRKTVRNMRGVPAGLELDPARAEALTIGPRLWTFIMTKEASARWDALGSEPVTLGVLAPGLDRPFVERVLVALPDKDKTVRLEMHDSDGRLLWTGSGRVNKGELEFSMPITRPRVKAKGMMAGRLTSKGKLTLSDSRLPKPARKRRPKLESVE